MSFTSERPNATGSCSLADNDEVGAGRAAFRAIGRGRRVTDLMIRAMHADYERLATFAAVGRLYDRHPETVRRLFQRRGMPLRPSVNRHTERKADGTYKAFEPIREREIQGMIDRATKLKIPDDLRLEWREWPMARRRRFIARLRAKLDSPRDRLRLPFSKNVKPFEYGTPEAHAIADAANAGTDSRGGAAKLRLCSQGVIWGGQLWFWRANTGYQQGDWTPGLGRPVLHRVIYDLRHGKNASRGKVVICKDGNPNNLDPANLGLVTKNDICRQNQAVSLLKKSREMTAVLLARNQEKGNKNGLYNTVKILRNRKH
jgi:hypothetical protein